MRRISKILCVMLLTLLMFTSIGYAVDRNAVNWRGDISASIDEQTGNPVISFWFLWEDCPGEWVSTPGYSVLRLCISEEDYEEVGTLFNIADWADTMNLGRGYFTEPSPDSSFVAKNTIQFTASGSVGDEFEYELVPEFTYTNMDAVQETGPYMYSGLLVRVTPTYPKPVLSVSSSSGKPLLTWTNEKMLYSGDYYEIYRSTSQNGTYSKIGKAFTKTYTDSSAEPGQTYYYKVRAICTKNSKGSSAYSAVKSFKVTIPAPKISSLTNTADGIKISWSKVPEAAQYYVYRKTSSGWTKIGSTTALSYTNKSVTCGTKYYYTVKAVSGNGALSSYAGGKGLTRVGRPEISSISNTSSGIQIKWNKVPGASQYYVYRKTSSGWTKIGSTTSLSYTNKSVTSGTKYYYTVKAVSSDGTLSAYAAEKNLYHFSQPVISISNASDGLKISWSKVPGAAQYYVYRKTSSGWTKIGSTTSLSYTNKSVTSGTKYYYTVKACTASGLTQSAYAGGKGLTRVAPPCISTISNTTSGIKLTWSKVAGASKYYVYRKTTSGWTKIGSTTSLSYTNKSVTKGTKYYYTVKAVSSDGTLSAYAPGKGLTR